MGSNLSSDCSCESASKVVTNDRSADDARSSVTVTLDGGCSQPPQWAAIPVSPERAKSLQDATVDEQPRMLPSRKADVQMFPSQAVRPTSRFLEYSVVFNSSRKIKTADEEEDASIWRSQDTMEKPRSQESMEAIWRSEETVEVQDRPTSSTPEPVVRIMINGEEEPPFPGSKVHHKASASRSQKDGAIRPRGHSSDSKDKAKEVNAHLARPNSVPAAHLSLSASPKEPNASLARPNSSPVTLPFKSSDGRDRAKSSDSKDTGGSAKELNSSGAKSTVHLPPPAPYVKATRQSVVARPGRSPTRLAPARKEPARTPSADANNEQLTLKHLCDKHGLCCGIKWRPHGKDEYQSAVLDMDQAASYSGTAPEYVEKSISSKFTAGKGMIGRVWQSQAKELIPNVHYLDGVIGFPRKDIAIACKIRSVFAIYLNNAVYEFDTAEEIWGLPFEGKDIEEGFAKAKRRASLAGRPRSDTV